MRKGNRLSNFKNKIKKGMGVAKYNHFLFLGLKTSSVLDNKYPQGFITYPDIFSETDDVIYSVVLTKRAPVVPEEGDNISEGMILISSNKDLGMREGWYYGSAIETLLPISYFCIAKIYENFSILPLSQESYERLTKPWKFADIIKECGEEITNLYNDPLGFSHNFHSHTGRIS